MLQAEKLNEYLSYLLLLSITLLGSNSSTEIGESAFKVPMACYFMDAYIKVLVAPNTVFEDVQEIQPWFRNSASTSQSH